MEDMNAEKKENRQINVLLLIVIWDIYLIIKKENVYKIKKICLFYHDSEKCNKVPFSWIF